MRGMLFVGALALGCGGNSEREGGEPFVASSTGSDESDATGASSTSSTLTSATSGSSGAASTTSSSSGTDSLDTTPATSSSTSGEGSTGEPARCAAGHECFFFDGVFHTSTERDPLFVEDLDVIAPQFSALEVELDVVHGGWYTDDPAGQHNIIWLHRGRRDNFTWAGGVAGYVNTRGPNTNIIRTRHDLDVASLDDSRVFNINGIALQPGTTYRVFYRHDPIAGEVLVRIWDGDTLIAEGTDPATTDAIRNDDNGFFIQCGNSTDVESPGPEVPSLGWVFSDMRVEFIP